MKLVISKLFSSNQYYISYFIFFSAICLLFPILLSRNSLILLSFCLIVRFFLEKRKGQSIFHHPEVLLPILLFLVFLLSIPTHFPMDFQLLDRWLLLIVLPGLFFLNLEVLSERTIHSYLLKGLTLGNLLVGILNIVRALYSSIKLDGNILVFDSSLEGGKPFWFSIDHGGNYFFGIDFSTFMHPSYWAMYLLINVVILWKQVEFGNIVIIKNSIARWCLVIFFLALIGMLSSRAGILAAFVLVILLIINDLVIEIRRKHVKEVIILTLSLLLTSSFFLNPRVLNLMQTLNDSSYSESPRFRSWKVALEIIDQHWLLGVGVQHSQDELNKIYERKGFNENLINNYNVHNQFLETFVATGIIGLLVLMAIFVFGFRQAILTRNMVLGLFLVNLIIHYSFESMLSRYHGVVVIAFLYPFFYAYSKDK